MNLNHSISAIARALAQGEYSSVELTRAYLEQIAAHDGALNAFITVTDERALEQAKAADARRAKGENHPLLGVPLAHQDVFCTAGVRSSGASRMLDDFIAPYDATVVSKLDQLGM
ncbi:MAG: Asp-tRNA(Asn)/Glu-tRNA(Gln) amidotransferase GatCAB subunit A, partial [Pseudomonadales bacterium]|nr:Asp-tRNA(Asn)/Glu-tRNA(Gln) amidotransferase GatCAB subunit A [Pseudomonadales bacterium]